MVLLSASLYILQCLTIVFCINSFVYDRRTKRFRRCAALHWIVLFSKWVFMTPVKLFFVYPLVTGLGRDMFNNYMRLNIHGADALNGARLALFIMFCVLKYAFSFYSGFILTWRRGNIEEMLNAFVKACDEHSKLFKSKLRIRWTLMSLLCFKVLTLEFVVCVGSLYKKTFPLRLLPLYIFGALFLVQPLLLSLATHFGLVLLHALYRDAQHHSKEQRVTWRRKRLVRVLTHYSDLLQLYVKFKNVATAVFLFELLSNSGIAMFFLHISYITGNPFIAACALVHPIVYVFVTDRICEIRKTLATDLLRFDQSPLNTNEQLNRVMKLSCLQRFLVDEDLMSSFTILHLRRSFILAFLEFAWINSMVLNSFYLEAEQTNTTRLYTDWANRNVAH